MPSLGRKSSKIFEVLLPTFSALSPKVGNHLPDALLDVKQLLVRRGLARIDSLSMSPVLFAFDRGGVRVAMSGECTGSYVDHGAGAS